jgi:uncharacterized protein YcgI (DUF1989 family)
VDSFVIPIRSGKAWKVPAGHVCRMLTVDGLQVGYLNLLNFNNPRERFWAARTRQLQAVHVTTFDRLWSNLPYLRPLPRQPRTPLRPMASTAAAGASTTPSEPTATPM